MILIENSIPFPIKMIYISMFQIYIKFLFIKQWERSDIQCFYFLNINVQLNPDKCKMSSKSLPATRLINVGQNGVGRYVCQLARITLRFCKHSPTSRGMR